MARRRVRPGLHAQRLRHLRERRLQRLARDPHRGNRPVRARLRLAQEDHGHRHGRADDLPPLRPRARPRRRRHDRHRAERRRRADRARTGGRRRGAALAQADRRTPVGARADGRRQHGARPRAEGGARHPDRRHEPRRRVADHVLRHQLRRHLRHDADGYRPALPPRHDERAGRPDHGHRAAVELPRRPGGNAQAHPAQHAERRSRPERVHRGHAASKRAADGDQAPRRGLLARVVLGRQLVRAHGQPGDVRAAHPVATGPRLGVEAEGGRVPDRLRRRHGAEPHRRDAVPGGRAVRQGRLLPQRQDADVRLRPAWLARRSDARGPHRRPAATRRVPRLGPAHEHEPGDARGADRAPKHPRVPALPGPADGAGAVARGVPEERRLPRAAAASAALNTGAAFWLEQALAAAAGAAACPPLAGAASADFCVVGGGYTGLWTALELLEEAPDARVVVLEAGACGFGASGRNGGWMTSWVDELDGLADRFGEGRALWLADESSATIGRIERFTQENGIDCHFRGGGGLWVASSPAQVEIVDGAIATAARLGRGDLLEAVGAGEVERRTGTRVARSGALVKDSAAVQPALLARGLRRVALERGIRIYEGSPMIRLERTRPATVVTPAGRIEADQVVLASNAWSARVRELRRTVAVVGSQIVLTEPIPERLRDLDWAQRGTLLGDARLFVHYAQVTTDGRIAFGRGGGALGPASRVVPKHFYDPATAASVADDFRRWFPQLADVRLTHAWGGAVDRAPGHLPFVGVLGEHANVHYALGYSGNGVGPSALIGRVLARRALGTNDAYATCGLVGGPPGYLPPEPLRFAGGALVRSAVRRAEEREEAGRDAGLGGRLAKRLVTFALPPLRRRPPAGP